MFVCLCNPFNDTAVKEHLAAIPHEKTTARDIYNACSGRKKPNCGQCIRNKLNQMVKEHNDGITSPAALAVP